MTVDPTTRMNRIQAFQDAANFERIALIADTLDHLGHGRPDNMTVSWYKGQDSGLPLPNCLTLTGKNGETTVDEELPEPAYQQLLALLEQTFDPSLQEGDEHFDLSAPALPGVVTQNDLDLLTTVADELEEQGGPDAFVVPSDVGPNRTTRRALQDFMARMQLFSTPPRSGELPVRHS